jgi:hypothetical protein
MMTAEQVNQMNGIQPEVKEILIDLIKRIETLEGAGA